MTAANLQATFGGQAILPVAERIGA